MSARMSFTLGAVLAAWQPESNTLNVTSRSAVVAGNRGLMVISPKEIIYSAYRVYWESDDFVVSSPSLKYRV